ncbi:MAG: hypothetical protein RR357_01890 [Clostridia bacterium]
MTKKYESLPKMVKIVLQIFLGAFIGGIYRLLKYFETKKPITLVAGILCLFTGVGNVIVWVVDLYTEVTKNKITFFAD